MYTNSQQAMYGAAGDDAHKRRSSRKRASKGPVTLTDQQVIDANNEATARIIGLGSNRKYDLGTSDDYVFKIF